MRVPLPVHRPATGARLRRAVAAGLLAALLPLHAVADGVEDAMNREPQLTGRDIYERVIANRFHSYVQDLRLVSSDRGRNAQETQLTITWKNFRKQDGDPSEVLSKTKVLYTEPFEVRFSAYLIINNRDRVNDQFVYLPSRRRVRRVNLRGENLFGTDFSFEDVVPRELEESTYRRLSDAVVQGVPVFVILATPKPDLQSEYSRFMIYVEQEHFVPLETHYWDEAGVEVKRLWAEHGSIREFDGVWMPMRAVMRNLVQDSETALVVESVTPNPDLPLSTFDIRSLETH